MPGTATVSETIVKQVRCLCGAQYAYRMERTATGGYHGLALTQDVADEKAGKDAAARLEELLKSGVEACKCPQCGKLTSEMQKKLEADRANHYPQLGLAVLIGVVAMAIAGWIGWRSSANFEADHVFLGLSLGLTTFVVGGAGVVACGFGLFGLFSGYQDSFVDVLTADSHEPKVPESEQALQRGLALFNQGNSGEGLASMEEARRLGHPRAAGLIEGIRLSKRIIDMAHAGERELALQALEEFSRLVPPPDAESVRGFRGIIDAVPKGKLAEPQDAIGWNNLGATFMDVGKFEQATECWFRAIDMDPDYEKAWLNLGLAYSRKGEFDFSLTVFERYLDTHHNSEQAWLMKGMVLANLDRREDAVSSYDRALALNPRLTVALIHKSGALIQMNRIEEAFATCQQGLESSPKNLNLLFNKAKALYRLGREAEAIACGQEMKRIDPEKAAELLSS